MKKYILSLFTILSFSGYALYERQINPAPPAVAIDTTTSAGNGRPGRTVAVSDVMMQSAPAPITKVVTPTPSPLVPKPTPTPIPVSRPAPVPAPIPAPAPVAIGKFKDGTYDGDIADVYYGLVQVQAVVRNGKLVDVVWLSYPNENPTSASKSARARPILTQEAIAAQDAQVDRVSGASATSGGFVDSLASALLQAKA